MPIPTIVPIAGTLDGPHVTTATWFPVTASWLSATTTCLLALALAGYVVCRLRRAWGTTLVAPGLWALWTLAAIAVVELLLAWRGVSRIAWTDACRYAAAMTVFCPTMAILGAKRPQERGWQWVVVTLLATLWMPVGQWYLLHRAGPFVLFAVWRFFVFALLLVGLLNYLPTRRAAASLLAILGQLLLVASPTLGLTSLGSWAPPLAMVLFLFTIIAWYVSRAPSAALPYDRLWFDFRDSFGAFWAIRVMQRVNETAGLERWNLRLTWHGFQGTGDGGQEAGDGEEEAEDAGHADAELSPIGALFGPNVEGVREDGPENRQVERIFRTLLRRFVSPEWIDRRLQDRGARPE